MPCAATRACLNADELNPGTINEGCCGSRVRALQVWRCWRQHTALRMARALVWRGQPPGGSADRAAIEGCCGRWLVDFVGHAAARARSDENRRKQDGARDRAAQRRSRMERSAEADPAAAFVCSDPCVARGAWLRVEARRAVHQAEANSIAVCRSCRTAPDHGSKRSVLGPKLGYTWEHAVEKAGVHRSCSRAGAGCRHPACDRRSSGW